MVGRKRKSGLREKNGKPQRVSGGSSAPSRLMVLRAAAANAALGSQAGQAWLDGLITAQQYDQAKRLSAIIARYHAAIGARGIPAQAYELGMTGSQADPESDTGAAQAEHDAAAVRRYIKARDSLTRSSKSIWEATRDFCADVYCDWSRRGMAIVGLGILADMAHKNNPRGGLTRARARARMSGIQNSELRQ